MRARTSSPSTLASQRHQHAGALLQQFADIGSALPGTGSPRTGRTGRTSVTMPILLPDLVRRSARSSTVAASRSADAPCFTAREKLAQLRTRSFVQHGRHRHRADGPTGRSRWRRIRACSRSSADQLSHFVSRRGSGAPPPNSAFWPARASSCARLAWASIFFHARRLSARSRSSSSKAPAAARLSSTFLFTSRGLSRCARSARLAKRLGAT